MSNEKGIVELLTADEYYFAGDFKTAFDWYIKAAELGNSNAITQVGLMYYSGIGTEVDYNAAFNRLNRGFIFLHRNAPVFYTLGEMYFYGRGVEQDYSKAFQFYFWAYGNGHNINAAFRVAEMYEYGYGTEIDNQRAVDYYTRAAHGGNVVAMSKLGLIYETGELAEQNLEQAKQWYFLAAANGDEFAAAKLEDFAD